MLREYEKKRDFTRTREPGPGTAKSSKGSLRFVIQKHAASRLHYDFRLELDGVLKSWAVPKGPSLNPQDKRLAAFVEDHPLDYGTFEGVIGHGNYGAGQVIVWDSGYYSPDEGGLSFGNREEAEERMRRDLEKGKLSFTLRGKKLKGSWTLVRTTRGPKDWLLIKHKDRYVDTERDVLEEDRSVQSGLTLEDLKNGRLPDPSKLATDWLSEMERIVSTGTETAYPKRLKPMMAGSAQSPFSHPGWLFEPKLDGYRVMAFLHGGEVTLLSRNGLDLTSRLPEVASDLKAQEYDEMVLDGEVAALDEDGLPDFGLIQHVMGFDKGAVDRPIGGANMVYYPFDLLYLDGVDLRKVPLIDRKKLLSHAFAPSEHTSLVEYVEDDGASFYRAAVGLGLEGIIAKRRSSVYEPGKRSNAWLKIKHVKSQELVVGGYTRGAGARSTTFGALLVGYYEGGELRYAGRVGTGYDNSMLEKLHSQLAELEAEQCPFAWAEELSGAENCWVRPELVAQVKFANWTDDGRLRAPVFHGLRLDVDPKSVNREAEEAVVVVPAEARLVQPPKSEETDVSQLLERLSGNEDAIRLDVDGYRISLTNLNKVLWPEDKGTPAKTKRDMIRYYLSVGHVLLPHLKDRPMTLTRYPNGIDGGSFYQKHSEHAPDFVEKLPIFSSHNEGDGEYLMVDNLPTLVWLAQLANIEFHPWLSRAVLEPDATNLGTSFTSSRDALEESVLNYPDFIVFDLDPYVYSGKEQAGDEPQLNRRAFKKVVDVAYALKEILDQLSLSSYVKTSGKTGLHIYVPVLRQYNYRTARKTCELIGRFLLRQLPMDVTMEWSVGKRTGKIFLDHNQNTRGKNMASIYSVRPAPGAPVSTPVRWEELGEIYPTDFTIDTVPDRIEKIGDLWADILQSKHDLRRLLESDQQ